MSDDGPSAGQPRANVGNPSYQAWRDIRNRSIIDFVNGVSKDLGARTNRKLREQLYDVVFSNGMTTVSWEGVSYTGPMLLDLYRSARREAQSL